MLAAVTCYFNFARSSFRLRNYQRFAEELKQHGLPLWTIEAALPGEPFDLIAGPQTVQRTVSQALWHKERLLNLLWPALPTEYDAICWIDADVLFSSGIVSRTLRALDRWPVAQMFRYAEWLDSDGHMVPYGPKMPLAPSMGYRNWSEGRRIVAPHNRHPGLAWAARREILERIGGLFDQYPAGSGDVFTAMGLYGVLDTPYLAHYNSATIDVIRAWISTATPAVNGNVGYVQGVTRHLYHGERESRLYQCRHEILRTHGFDPRRHQRVSNGVYEFTEDCPAEIVAWMRQYLRCLRE